MNSFRDQEKTIHVSKLVFSYLKKWRIILAAMFAGAFLFGVFQVMGSARTVINSTIISENQQKIDTNNNEINDYYNTIGYEDQTEAIKARNDIIAQTKAKLNFQKDALETYEGMLEEVEELEDEASASRKIDLLSLKSEIQDSIQDLNTKIEDNENTINYYETDINNVKDYFETIDDLKKENKKLEEEMNPQIEQKSLKRVVSYIVFGAVLGAILVAFVVLFFFLINKKIDCADSIKERYRLPVLSNVHTVSGKHKAKLDLYLEKWNGEVRKRNIAHEYELLAAKLQAICPEEQREILLCGSISSDDMKTILNGIQDNLRPKINVVAVGNPVKNAKAAVIIKNKNIVLVEKIDFSVYTEIDELIEQAELENARILGFVLL